MPTKHYDSFDTYYAEKHFQNRYSGKEYIIDRVQFTITAAICPFMGLK